MPDTIRYVHPNGKYSNDGLSWATAKNSVQDAINDLYQTIERRNLPGGSVYVASGKYVPSESTESSGGSMLNTSFKVYEGIHVYGGFNADDPEDSPDERIMLNGKTWAANWAARPKVGVATADEVSGMWQFKYETVLSGNHSNVDISFSYDSVRGRFNMAFPASSFHVIWFGTNGEITGVGDGLLHHFKSLSKPAWIDGCVIEGGNASNRVTSRREHASYGGGAYMVGNSALYNCTIRKCAASLRGGGVYMDGGGKIDHCYVHTCEATGVGIVQGYGGAVCIDYDGAVEHCYLTQSTARIGGGLAICHVPSEYPVQKRIEQDDQVSDTISYYSPYAAACVIANNTTNAEGGGVYCDEGGSINHCTIVRNKCIGPDVTYYGRRHGRSGGIYIRNCGMMYNSVAWGNACTANNDIQFASIMQEKDAAHQIFIYHCGFMNHDITDWTFALKDMVYNVEKSNMPVYGVRDGIYPCFMDPSPYAGVLAGKRNASNEFVSTYPELHPEDYPLARSWHPLSFTSLAEKGVQVTDAVQIESQWIRHAHTSTDVVGNTFEAVSSLGALVRSNENISYALVVPQGKEYRDGSEEERKPIPTLFVDPNRAGNFDGDNKFVPYDQVGNSWDLPLHTIGDAIDYFRRYLIIETKGGKVVHKYRMPKIDDPSDSEDFDYVQILVKAGVLTTAGPGNYLGTELRTAAIRVESHMRLYGAYPDDAIGTNTEGRDPRAYVTRITANITGGTDSISYLNNSAHVVCFVNTANAIVDGFRLYDGNTHNISTTNSVLAGGCVLVNNANVSQENRIDMVGNKLRNCVLANCTAPKGAAVYVNGEHPKADGEASYAELLIENCVIRNNTADYLDKDHGVITANGRAFININHCDVVNNVGYPFKTDNKTTATESDLAYHGYIQVANTIVFANGDKPFDNRGIMDSKDVLSVNDTANNEYVFGSYNLFDYDAPKAKGFKDGFKPSKPYITTMEIGKVTNNKFNLTRTDRSATTYPVFQNPSRNVGHSYGGDKPIYGGSISYLPMNLNPCVNAANPASASGRDRSDILTRDYGGAPDIGAIESTNLPAKGMVLYVTPEGAGKRDGSSWANAIAGNYVYALARATNETPWDITGEGTLVPTTDSRYAGGRWEDDNSLYPYGEKSNFSKPFWDPSTGNTHNNTARKQIIKNNRDEDYVSGLQYAVEKASAYNTLADDSEDRIEGIDSVQVWVGNGTYTDIKGYVMRNKTSVLGGFPTTTYSTPGLTERIALLAQGIHKPDQYEDKAPADYETILQVSDKSPQIKTSFSSIPAQDLTVENGTTDGKMYRLRSMSRNMYLQAGSSNAVLADLDTMASNQLWQIYTITSPEGITGTMLFSVGARKFLCISVNENVLTQPSSITAATCMWNISGNTISRLIDASKFLKANDSGTNVVTNGAASDATRIQWVLEDYVYNAPAVPMRTDSIDIPKLDARSPFAGTTAQTITANDNSDEKLKIIRNVGRDLYAGVGTYNQTKGIVSEYSVGNANQLWQIFELDKQGHVLIYSVGERKFIGMSSYNLHLAEAASITTDYVWNMVKDDSSGFTRILRCGQTNVNSGTGWGTDTTNDGIWSDKTMNKIKTCAQWEITDYNGEVQGPIERIESVSIPALPALTLDVQFEPTLAAFSGSGSTIYRKPVLFMPDVCLPTWSPSNYTNNNDDISNTYRVDPEIPGYGGYSEDDADTLYVEYTKVVWDGFTIRHGYYNQYNANRDGGAGVRMFRGATLQNCVVRENANFGGGANTTSNTSGSKRARGGGIYMDSYNSKVVSCYVVENYTSGSTNAYGGGAYLIIGTSYNSLYANNTCTYNVGNEDGSGVFLEGATFYNNTIAYNNGIGICHWTNEDNRQTYLEMYNCIIYGNTMQGTTSKAPKKLYSNNFKNNYIQNNSIGENKILASNNNLFGTAAADNPFEAANPLLEYDFRLKGSSKCINAGISEPFGENGVYITLPPYDVAYTDRVQDCQVDIGAHEYDGSKDIRPDTTSHPGYAIYYVAHNSRQGGNASADSPENAACKGKLQKVIDAAGRYKYALMTESQYATVQETPVKGMPDKSWIVQVRLAGDSIDSDDPNSTPDYYTATRSTKYDLQNFDDNVLDYSLIIPHGVQILGGYSTDYYHDDNGTVVDERNPLTYRTIFSGKLVSSTGAESNAYHVVTFTNDLFATDQYRIGDGGQLDNESYNNEANRAVLDGIFISDGVANSPDQEDQRGAGAVVSNYAHIRNCVVNGNKANDKGGGLYLLPGALVSGTIIKNNTALIGGGLYIDNQHESVATDTAHVFATTICANHANSRAGGVWFDDNVRINSCAIWQNTSNDNANIAGQYSATAKGYPVVFTGVEVNRLEGQGNIELSAEAPKGVRWDERDLFSKMVYYPIEMSSTLARAGMDYASWREYSQRFATLDSIDIAGVSRMQWNNNNVLRTGLWGLRGDTLVVKHNDYIEMGARAFNGTFAIIVDTTHVLYRIFVLNNDNYDDARAHALQNNILQNSDNNKERELGLVYAQMGSCMLNPFHRLSDAFDYIITIRKQDDKYRNSRFEVFVDGGTFYPRHNIYGEEGRVRTHTFAIPEGVTVIGGIDATNKTLNYCQAGYANPYEDSDTINGHENITMTIDVNGVPETITLQNVPTDTIRLRRPMRDFNSNSVIEPWEFAAQTIFSGDKVSEAMHSHVYHIISCYADSSLLGKQPYKFRTYNKETQRFSDTIPINYTTEDKGSAYNLDEYYQECEESKAARSVILDGLTVTGGYANALDSADEADHLYQTKTYFRGGGVFVDGNWTQDFDINQYIPNVTDPAKYNIPMVIRNCKFQNNMAGNGGAVYSNGDLHIFSTHFTQNYAQGPINELDQDYIPWSAGGCIATNAYCGVTNCLFDNNEAKRGAYAITAKSGYEYIPDADARQGFAGVISAAVQSQVRAINCHFVKNKAVAYPAIYNFQPNNYYSDPDSMHFAVNCLFWGNEATGIKKAENASSALSKSVTAFTKNYEPSMSGVFNYDRTDMENYNTLLAEYDELYNGAVEAKDTFNTAVINKLNTLRTLANNIEGLYFCAYSRGDGLEPAHPQEGGYLMTKDESDNYQDVRRKTVKMKNGKIDYSDMFSHVYGNNNVLVNKQNDVVDGPNFVQPSSIAGIDGYMQNADWLFERINVTTDAGWGFLKQKAFREIDHYEYDSEEQAVLNPDDENKLKLTIEQYEDSLRNVVDFNSDNKWFPVYDLERAQYEATDDTAFYNYHSYRLSELYRSPLAPIADQQYMLYTRLGDNVQRYMNRISVNPRLGIEGVYVDIGIYEYQYVQLDFQGYEVDTIWVTDHEESIDADGRTWATAYSDINRAIYELMRSHNNHDKYICFKEGNYSPNMVIDGRRSYVVDVPNDYMEINLPRRGKTDTDYYVKSLTFLGGWSKDAKEAGRDPEANPTVITMPEGSANTLNQLFFIGDMTRQNMRRTFRSDDLKRDTMVIPIAFDGIVFENNYAKADPESGLLRDEGGAAIYYRYQRKYEYDKEEEVLTMIDSIPLFPAKEIVDRDTIELPKLIISNCIFRNNGQRTVDPINRSAAVRIDHGGGYSLIVNSLFHSNAGAPLYVPRPSGVEKGRITETPNYAHVVNCTFALNEGHTTLENSLSQVHNTLIWKDDLLNDTTVQLTIANQNWAKYAPAPQKNDSVTNNAFFGVDFDADANKNENLVAENSDLFNGPSFVNPIDSIVTQDTIRRKRDFHLQPSVRTMDMADTATYRRLVFGKITYNIQDDESSEAVSGLWARPFGIKHRVNSLRNDSDLAAMPRFLGVGMERGAYECQAILQRVLYVEPSKTISGSGASWEDATNQLQLAIQSAAIYSYFHRTAAEAERRSYVFVKTANNQADANINPLSGVQIYGGVPTQFYDTVPLTLTEYTTEDCLKFVNAVKSVRDGVASPSNGFISRINTINGEHNADFDIDCLIDGFVINNSQNANSQPIVNVNNQLTISNCMFTGNSMSASVPMVKLNKGLIYNSLFYNNDADIHINVGSQGLVLNTTVVANQPNQTTINATGASDKSVVNTITINESDNEFNRIGDDSRYVNANTRKSLFLPQLRNTYRYPSGQLPSFLTAVANPQLWYQLHDYSPAIDAGVEVVWFGGSANNNTVSPLFEAYRSNIDFNTDRDVLGNPRRIRDQIDLGGYETWSVENIERANNKSDQYCGHKYPHRGSVVYINENSDLVVELDAENNALFDAANAIQPAYLLLKSGASLYGQGNTIRAEYVAVDKIFEAQQYSLTAMPFNYNLTNALTFTYRPAADRIDTAQRRTDFEAYYYSGADRAQYNYTFSADKSYCWKPITNNQIAANDGWLLDFGTQIAHDTIRFTGWITAANTDLYTENGNAKIVLLNQYDHRTDGQNGSDLDFTRLEDMGWNMRGMPFLVSNYATAPIDHGTYQMHIPHLIYQMSGAGDYLHEMIESQEQIFTSRSWTDDALMTLGNAWFTQTSDILPTEKLLFKQPYYVPRPVRLIRPIVHLANAEGRGDILEIIPDSKASKVVSYSLGSDGIKWMNQEHSQIWINDAQNRMSMSFLASAPTEVDMTMGINVAKSGTYTISLPDPEAFEPYNAVWLTDKKQNRIVNLLNEPYSFDLSSGTDVGRFTLRIGGVPRGSVDKRSYIVFSHGKMLYLRGLLSGDKVRVYASDGKLITNLTADQTEYAIPLPQGVYGVIVNDYNTKVISQ